ncbi:Hypothetical_protein [Hexamita inflata]|uniref:Hypothetical_protein n=1 Tax=Hexamita inflata TaxID=28002 RepID=A0AA86UEM4_9EUKA|nr:Hypothetical protein HINF_LOCUS40334 [Hexamita inflata]
MMSKKYRLSVPKILESILNSPKILEPSSSLDFFSKYTENELSAEQSFDSEIKTDHLFRQLKIVLLNNTQSLDEELQFLVKLETKIAKIEQNMSVIKMNHKILVQQILE